MNNGQGLGFAVFQKAIDSQPANLHRWVFYFMALSFARHVPPHLTDGFFFGNERGRGHTQSSGERLKMYDVPEQVDISDLDKGQHAAFVAAYEDETSCIFEYIVLQVPRYCSTACICYTVCLACTDFFERTFRLLTLKSPQRARLFRIVGVALFP